MIIFGAGKLTEVGGSLGRGIKESKAKAAGGQPDAAIATDSGRNDEGRGLGSRELRADQI